MSEPARIDRYATHEHDGVRYRVGDVAPFGATFVPGGVNFSIFSSHATSCTLVLFNKGEREPFTEIPFPPEFRIGNVYAMTILDLDVETVEYGYRVDGPWDPEAGHRFDPERVLLDPYARVIGGRDVWGEAPDWDDRYPYRARLAFRDFDWEGDRPLEHATEDLVIYEAHVRSMTRHPSSGVKHPGTFTGLREAIPYLKDLGINCIELMPIYEFDEFENSRSNPETGELLVNYWGYSTVGFFAPKAGYATTGKIGMQVDELKTLVKELHRSGIEVILDVVFNHTAEGDHRGPTISFRGLDNKTYYMLTPDGYYVNYSGTGNTLNCNHPVTRDMVLDCLRYWAAEYHVDGFRFDLASILDRDPWGAPLANPPLLESLAFDPILAKCKLIAEAWDAGGLYQVGTFPAYGRWAEWNGRYRDTLRKWIKGEPGLTGELAQRLAGSPDLYGDRGPTASINFVTAHDGFTLHDLVSYNEKRNHANGEGNGDGANDNDSWNCGAEGVTDDEEVLRLRERQMRNALTLLLTSQGVPMLLMGDEVARTQHGNNNAYCHDSELSWFDWGDTETHADLLRFVKRLIAFRNAHPVLRNRWFLSGTDSVGSGRPDLSFHGRAAWQPDWGPEARTLAFLLDGAHARGGTDVDDSVYVATNSHWEAHGFELPSPGPGRAWHVAVNTAMPSPDDIHEDGQEPAVGEQGYVLVGARSTVVLVTRPIPERT